MLWFYVEEFSEQFNIIANNLFNIHTIFTWS